MKYTKAQFIWGPSNDDKITFDLDDISYTTPYAVKSISGLEAPLNAISLGDKLFEGSYLQGIRPESRQIVMLISLQPNYLIGQDAGVLRKNLNKMLSPRQGSDVKFRLLDDLELDWVQAVGRVKSIEANPYVKDPEVQITFPCLSAYFEEPVYTFPGPATLSGKTTIQVTNNGDVPMGIYLEQTLTANMASYILTGVIPSQFIKITYPFLANDRLLINTNPGFRSIKRIRTGVADVNLLPYLSLDSTWLMMDYGLNTLTPSTIAYTVQALIYTQRHWGF